MYSIGLYHKLYSVPTNRMLVYFLQVQFVVTGAHTCYIFVTKCDYPEGLKLVHIIYMLTLIVLFSNFYMKSYTKKPSSQPSSEVGGAVDKKHQ